MTDIEAALAHFRKADPVMHAAGQRVKHLVLPRPKLRQNDRLFSSLCESVVSQQLSVKASDTIFTRLKQACGGNVTSDSILKITVARMRACGLSGAKSKTLKEIAQAVKKGLVLTALHHATPEEATLALTRVWGIGPWTAEMFLMSGLGHTDIFSVGDLGLVRAIEELYGVKNPTRAKLLAISASWSPYRSLASRILWKHRDQ